MFYLLLNIDIHRKKNPHFQDHKVAECEAPMKSLKLWVVPLPSNSGNEGL